jgi:hypothetical protein|tara:strand:+ start:30482 stop:31060 length:579 start_codon:yes stop_codon:yes gene_type:complete
MKKNKLNKRQIDQGYIDNSYDEIRSLLEITRNPRNLILEQEYETAQTDVEVEDAEVEEKTKEYNVSGGLIITHGVDEMDLELTDEDKGAFQETMDEFVEQVSDMVDYGPLNIYKTNVEWSGKLVKFDLSFFYTIGEVNGVYIGGANMVQIDDELTDLLEKLKRYYGIFSKKWATILSQRKKTEESEEEEGIE